MIKSWYDFFLKQIMYRFEYRRFHSNVVSVFQKQKRNEENYHLEQFYIQCTICWARHEIKIIYFCSYLVLFY